MFFIYKLYFLKSNSHTFLHIPQMQIKRFDEQDKLIAHYISYIQIDLIQDLVLRHVHLLAEYQCNSSP